MKNWRPIAAAVFLSALAVPAQSSTIFTSSLSQQFTQSGSTSTGLGDVVLNDAQNFITVGLSVFGLSSPPTFSGIFGPPSPFGAPVHLSFPLIGGSGNYIASASSSVDASFVAGLFSGQYYFNIFTQNFPVGFGSPGGITTTAVEDPLYTGGEIAGFITQDTSGSVPEPQSMVLAGLGIAAMAFRIARQRR